jgi:hypothetical protein
VQALRSEARSHLPWVFQLLRALQQHTDPDSAGAPGPLPPVFGSGADLAKTACACVYESRSTEAWGLFDNMLKVAEAGLEGDGALGGDERDAAKDMIRQVGEGGWVWGGLGRAGVCACVGGFGRPGG